MVFYTVTWKTDTSIIVSLPCYTGQANVIVQDYDVLGSGMESEKNSY